MLEPKIQLLDSEGRDMSNQSQVPAGIYDLTLTKRGYFQNNRQINVAKGQDNIYNLSMQPKISNRGELAATMTWEDKATDLDFHVRFKANSTDSCHVFFNHKQCGGAQLKGFSLEGGSSGAETITLQSGPSYYLFYVLPSPENKGTLPLAQSNAHIDIYSGSGDSQLISLDVPIGNLQADKWLAFCMNGRAGPASIVPLYWMTTGDDVDLLKVCEGIYGPLKFHDKVHQSTGNEVVFDFKHP